MQDEERSKAPVLLILALNLMPEVPTMKEEGLDMEAAVWYGLLAPAATPSRIVARLADVTVKAARAPDMTQRLLNLGAEPVGSTPAAFGTQLRAEVTQWAEVVRLSGARPK